MIRAKSIGAPRSGTISGEDVARLLMAGVIAIDGGPEFDTLSEAERATAFKICAEAFVVGGPFPPGDVVACAATAALNHLHRIGLLDRLLEIVHSNAHRFTD